VEAPQKKGQRSVEYEMPAEGTITARSPERKLGISRYKGS
jgi:hypothetical protein